jgi:hypothetical protein
MKIRPMLMKMVIGCFIITSCTKYPTSSDRLLEDLAIYTKYDTNTSFAQFKTFYISDTVKWIDSKDSGYYTDSQAQAITGEITKNMTNRGYEKVAFNQDPDIAFMVVAIKNVNVTVYSPGWYWGYPGYYPPWYWGGGGYYYPYYPTYVSSYSTGTLLIDMADLKNMGPDQKIWIRWNAYIRGLMTGSHTIEEIQQCIDQAFAQTKGFKQNL